MRVVFMGTPHFAVPSLCALAEEQDIDLVGVYTKPDSVSKRGGKLVASAVKEKALSLGLPVFQPKDFSDPADVDLLASLSPDMVVVASFGVILPRSVLDIPPMGCLNVHASLLPRWRGAAPIERAILAGDREMGVCIMKMEEGLDTGPWCMSVAMDPDEMGRDEITQRLADMGSSALLRAIREIEQGRERWTSQDESLVTYAHKIDKRELWLSPESTASDNVARVRASSSHAAARAVVCGRAMAVTAARAVPAGELESEDISAPAKGRVSYVRKRLLLGASDGAFELLRVKPDGKREMDAAGFAAGARELDASGSEQWREVE